MSTIWMALGNCSSARFQIQGGAVAEDDLSDGGDEAASLRLAMGALGKGGRLRGGVAAGCALNGGIVADRPRVAARPAVGVAPFGRPRRRQLDLAGLGEAVGLLAVAPGDLGRADRDAGPIQTQVTSWARGAGAVRSPTAHPANFLHLRAPEKSDGSLGCF